STTWDDPGTGSHAHVKDHGEFGYRLLWAVDVEKYSSRAARAQLLVQQELNNALATAAAGAGLEREGWHTEPRGDGELAVLPLEVDVRSEERRVGKEGRSRWSPHT